MTILVFVYDLKFNGKRLYILFEIAREESVLHVIMYKFETSDAIYRVMLVKKTV